jgi:peptide-methionine (R)-S-oxide reductase
MRRTLLNFIGLVFTISLTSCYAQNKTEMREAKVKKTDAEWRSILTDEQYFVLRQQGTERPHTGEYDLHFEDGIYSCAGCGAELFKSDDKFNAHCGWPSFDKAIDNKAVVEILDKSHGMIRTEIRCANCDGHLGHVFNDGPTETGMRYCINSVSLDFDAENEETKKTEK